MHDAFAAPPHQGSGPVDSEAQDRNAAIARRFVEQVLGKGDMTAFDEIVAEDVWVSTGLKPEAPITSKSEYATVIGSTLGTALSNGSMTVHEVLPCVDGAVLVRFTAEADHTGMLDGVAPTGSRFVLSETHLMRFKDGKLVQNHVGALNPLHWEMTYASTITRKLAL